MVLMTMIINFWLNDGVDDVSDTDDLSDDNEVMMMMMVVMMMGIII
jgi:hypothetical protein